MAELSFNNQGEPTVDSFNHAKFEFHIDTTLRGDETPVGKFAGSGHMIWEAIGSCFQIIRKKIINTIPRDQRPFWNAAIWTYTITVDFRLAGFNTSGQVIKVDGFRQFSIGTNSQWKPWPQVFRESAKALGKYGFAKQNGDGIPPLRTGEETIGGIVFVLNGSLLSGLSCSPLGIYGVSCEAG